VSENVDGSSSAATPWWLAEVFGGDTLFAGARTILVACSGGADSTALALLVAEWATARRGERPRIVLAHIHHGYRGAEADADEAFVIDLARKLGLESAGERVVPSRSPPSEAEARTLRFDAFRRLADAHAVDVIALAHHREDQQETVLLRICRGAGLRGLRGMRASRALAGCARPVRIVRPVLAASRDDLREFLRLRGQGFRHDATNDDPAGARNRLRLEVLPRLESQVHAGVRASLERIAALAARVDDDLEALADRALADSRVDAPGADELALDAVRLAVWPASVRHYVLRRAVAIVRDAPFALLDGRRTELADALVERASREAGRPNATGGAVELADGCIIERVRRLVVVRRTRAVPAPAFDAPECALAIDGGEVVWERWRLRASRAPWPGPDAASRSVEWVDAVSVAPGLVVRPRRAGDRFWPLGSTGHKKLEEFLRERGVAREGRGRWPLVVCGDEIVWVVGERIAEPFRVAAVGASAVRLEAHRERAVDVTRPR